MVNAAVMDRPFVLFDDMRPDGAGARIYERPVEEIAAASIEEVQPALDRLRAAVAEGRHAAGFIAYDACYALEPKLWALARQGEGPLLWFGLFEGYRTLAPNELDEFARRSGGRLDRAAGAQDRTPGLSRRRGDKSASICSPATSTRPI